MTAYPYRSVTMVLRLSLLLAVVLVFGYWPATLHAQQPANDVAKAAEALAQVNDLRVQEGLWPLAVNPTLEAMALAQASYILPLLPSIQDELAYHLDAQRRNPRQRAAAAGWPSYGTTADRIEIGENAGVGTLKFVMGFWQTSDIHRKAALSNVYREVGVAALPRAKGGFLYYMVFGARPGVLPVLATADGTQLYLTDEKSRYAGTLPATQVRLLDATGNPLTETLNWRAQLTVPAGAGDAVSVLYTSGQNQTTTQLNRKLNVAVLTATLGQVTTNTQVIAATTTPQVIAAQPTAAPVQPTIAPAQPTAVAAQPTAAPAQPTTAPAVNPANADLLLTYNANALFVLNTSQTPVDLSGLSIIGSGVTVGVQLWSRVGDVPVTAFPSSHCLAVRLINSDAPIPATCKWTRSIVDLTPAKIFWTLGDFIVSVNGTLLATCTASAGQCAVDLP